MPDGVVVFLVTFVIESEQKKYLLYGKMQQFKGPDHMSSLKVFL